MKLLTTRLSLITLLAFLTPAQADGNGTEIKTNYGVDAYECDAEGNYRDLDNAQKKVMGSVYRVCLKPNQAALDAGIQIEKLNWWEWKANDDITLKPVENGKPVIPGMASASCYKDGTLCVFDSFLTADFYQDRGSIEGYGEVVLTNGAGTVPVTCDLFLAKFTITLDDDVKEYIEQMKAQGDGDAKVDALMDQVNVEASALTDL